MTNMITALAAEGAVSVLDFSDILTTAFNSIQSDFAKVAMIAAPIGIAIWAAPRVVKLATKFFGALTH